MGLNRGEIVATGAPLAASDVTPGHAMGGPFTIILGTGWTGSVSLTVSGDDGTTYVNALLPDGTPNAFTTAGSIAVPNVSGPSLLFRLERAAGGTGTTPWRFVR